MVRECCKDSSANGDAKRGLMLNSTVKPDREIRSIAKTGKVEVSVFSESDP